MEKGFLISFFLVFLGTGLRAQDCQDCGSRQVFVYNLEIQSPVPASGHDSIMNFLNALKVTSAVKKYLSVSEMTANCLSVSGYDVYDALDSTDALSNTQYLRAVANLWTAPGSESPDYYITGSLQPVGGNGFTVKVQLQAGSSGEIIAWGLGNLDGYPSGDPESAAVSVMSQMTPV